MTVSIHASSREDATGNVTQEVATHGFNPRVLAGGRDIFDEIDHEKLEVSIHASSREDATVKNIIIRHGNTVSIHASSREDATAHARMV